MTIISPKSEINPVKLPTGEDRVRLTFLESNTDCRQGFVSVLCVIVLCCFDNVSGSRSYPSEVFLQVENSSVALCRLSIWLKHFVNLESALCQGRSARITVLLVDSPVVQTAELFTEGARHHQLWVLITRNTPRPRAFACATKAI